MLGFCARLNSYKMKNEKCRWQQGRCSWRPPPNLAVLTRMKRSASRRDAIHGVRPGPAALTPSKRLTSRRDAIHGVRPGFIAVTSPAKSLPLWGRCPPEGGRMRSPHVLTGEGGSHHRYDFPRSRWRYLPGAMPSFLLKILLRQLGEAYPTSSAISEMDFDVLASNIRA